MKNKENELDALFQSGFSREDEFARQIPEEEFHAFMASNKSRKPDFRAEWRRIILPLAASLLLFAGGGFFWNRFHSPTVISPEILAMETENMPATPVISDAGEEKQESKASAQIGGSNSKAAKEKYLRKKAAAPSKGRIRKKIRPALIAPGILPLPLIVDAGEKKQALQAESSTSLQLAVESSTEIMPLPEHKTNSGSDPNEIVSVEFRPGRGQLMKEAENQSGQEADLSLASGTFQTATSLRNIRNVEQAKSYLIRSLGRFIGLIPGNNREEVIETKAENNEL